MDPQLWAQRTTMQALAQEQTTLTHAVRQAQHLQQALQDASLLLDLAQEEQNASAITDVVASIMELEQQIKTLELQRLFSQEADFNDAYLDIQAGSGGTEAQDWANMLLRLYLRWGERRKFTTTLIAVSYGEVVGIKGATVKFIGPYAYGWLRTESGVHRLVRKSPFDANHKRHTSFASVFVSPDINEAVTVELNPADLRIDTYRASGAGGQHVNRTDSAVRITHEPTGIVVQCQNDRSQHKNRAQAMQQLRARLYQLKLQEMRAKQAEWANSKKEITWGSQIRSYVLDMSRIKDLRTGVEIGNVQAVLDGDIDVFIEASLLQKAEDGR